MIEVAVILSGVVWHWPDFFIILLLLLANAAVGFFEEREAGNAIEALKAKLAIKARVKRDGKLVAIEELAGVDVLCLDKTGTLTQNKLTLGNPFCIGDVSAEDLTLNGALASRIENNDTIDLAVIGGLNDKDVLKNFEIMHFLPFYPVHKRTEATVKTKDGKEFKVTKGAPQVILDLSCNAGQIKADVEKAVGEFAGRSFRSLGAARAEGEGGRQFLGGLPLFDPSREDAQVTIATALAMGVKIKMVTGDAALAIAQETAKKLNMGANIVDASGLGDVRGKNQEQEKSIEAARNAWSINLDGLHPPRSDCKRRTSASARGRNMP